MTMTPGVRRFALTAHVTCSVGWIGAVFVFLALAIVGLRSGDDLAVRGAYVAMERAAWFVLVPLAFASLVTGLVMSLGTAWGLFRHYWVVLKLLITVFASTILLIYMETFRQMAGVASDQSAGLALVRNPSPMVHAILALVLLIAAAALAVYKPLGMTAYGRRKQTEQRGEGALTAVPRATAALGSPSRSTPRWVYLAGVVALVMILVFVILHLAGGGVGSH
jgi:uncharacterized membrane protein